MGVIVVRYDDADVLVHPYQRREGDARPGAFFYILGHEGDGPVGWPGRERRVYEAPPRVVQPVQGFSRFDFCPPSRQDVREVFVRARHLHRLVPVGGRQYDQDQDQDQDDA